MTKSLNGLRVLNTRPEGQAKQLSDGINQAGGVSIECPALKIIASEESWENTLPDLSQANIAIFISSNAVRQCFNRLQQKGVLWPSTIKVIAIGEGTARALNEVNIPITETPSLPDSEHLLVLDSLQRLKNQTVLLFKGKEGRALIEETLIQRGAKIKSLSVYIREMPTINQQLIQSIWRNDSVDVVLLTSEHSIRNLFIMFGEAGRLWLQNKPCVVLSARIAKKATALGVKKIIISHPDRLINTLLDFKV